MTESFADFVATLEWRDHIAFEYRSQTPGLLHVTINGVRLGTFEMWDYHQSTTAGSWDTPKAETFADTPGWIPVRQGLAAGTVA
ncbi:hypothetical protein [Allorhizocola rhizosphaerae]|uniref:hypothetical protein n=1 Tax=Allorhizocola rhizosphaerae TaxID=1872709 RepID=UPI000E3D4334|nr:hypothetical protein [Allorhizocola rhizosphaerae]